MTDYEVITVGRVGVDLYPEQSGVSLSEVKTFAKHLGGSATNVAVAAARYGHRSAVITRVGDDGFGVYVRQALETFGVDPSFVERDPDLRTPIVFCELHPPDHFPLLFYREPKAPDMDLRLENIPIDEVRSAKIFWTTGTGLSDQPSRDTTLAALSERGSDSTTIHDLDYRPMFWASPEEAGDVQRKALANVTIAVGNREEVEVVVGSGTPEDQARRLLSEFPLRLAIVKLGPEGVLVAGEDGVERLSPVTVDIVNGLGAGDAFGGALCHGLLKGWDPIEIVQFGNAAGAYVAGRLACADAMPNEAQVRELMANGQGVTRSEAPRKRVDS